MRHLPHCKTFTTDSKGSASEALAEALLEASHQEREGATIISVSLGMTPEFAYYVDLTTEKATP
jgi:hypothetical protein